MERIRKADGVALRTLREDAWLCQEELSEAAGVSVFTISQIENGRAKSPRMKTLIALARGLSDHLGRRVHPNELLEGGGGSRAPLQVVDTLRDEGRMGAGWDLRSPDRSGRAALDLG